MGLIAIPSVYSEEISLIQDGTITIVLPEVTQTDQFLQISDEEILRVQRERFPKYTQEQLEKLIPVYRDFISNQCDQCGDEEQIAAEELEHYLSQMSGAAVKIVVVSEKDPIPSAPAILIGNQLAKRVGLENDLTRLEREGMLLKTCSRYQVLAGVHPRGTLYAAYDFLETYGVRWFMPGDVGEYVPESKDIHSVADKTENPSFSMRYWWCTYVVSPDYHRWTLRNKGNYMTSIGGTVLQSGHHLDVVLRWGENHPDFQTDIRHEDGTVTKGLTDDYYALTHGHPNHAVPNMSNPKVWKLYAEYYKEQFRQNPFSDCLSISAADGPTCDEHPESSKLDTAEWDRYMSVMSATERMWFFHNRYIDEVLKEFPGRKFGVLVYSNNMAPPRMVKVNPAMTLVFAPQTVPQLFDVQNPKSKSSREWNQWLQSWCAQANTVGADTYFYDYEPLGFCWNKTMICPRWAIIGKNYPYFHKLGIQGFCTQGWDDWGSSALDNWVMIRLFWNVNQDYHEIVRDYCQRRFLEAGAAMNDYYAVYEQRMEEIPEFCGNEIWGNHFVLTPEVRAEAREAMDKAKRSAVTPWAKKQVALASRVQDSTDAFCNAIEWVRETGDFAAGAKKLDEAFDIVDEMNKIAPNLMNIRAGRAGVLKYEPGGWQKKYLECDQRIHSASQSLLLPRYWKMCLDTDRFATTQDKCQMPETDVSAMDNWDITAIPDVKFQSQWTMAAFFLRTEFDVPESFQGKKAILYFPSLIAEAMEIWVDGKPVVFQYKDYEDTTWHGTAHCYDTYDHRTEFDLTGYITPGKKNTLCLRIFKNYDHAGSYDRVFLLAE